LYWFISEGISNENQRAKVQNLRRLKKILPLRDFSWRAGEFVGWRVQKLANWRAGELASEEN
jgi:hypothetical protein